MHTLKVVIFTITLLFSTVTLTSCSGAIKVSSFHRTTPQFRHFSFEFSERAKQSLTKEQLNHLGYVASRVAALNKSANDILANLRNPNVVNYAAYEQELREMDVFSKELCMSIIKCTAHDHVSYAGTSECGLEMAKDCGGVLAVSGETFEAHMLVADGIPSRDIYERRVNRIRDIVLDLCKRNHCEVPLQTPQLKLVP